MSFLKEDELQKLGLKHYGTNVLISRNALFYNPANIAIGNNVRIDAFCILSSGNEPFVLEDNIHISAGTMIYGQYGFHMEAFTNISVGCKVFTQSDSFCGNYMVGSTIPSKYKNVYGFPLRIHKHAVIGSGSILLPGTIINEGVAIGANSLVKGECKPWSIYAGSPVRFIKERSKKLLDLEVEFTKEQEENS
jgi:acetyltransferase-like isoleucine patch superfamily enzyme